MNARVSVIIPAYNAHDTIYGAIESVLRTGYDNLEIIVSDDCSDSPYYFDEGWGVNIVTGKTNRGAGVARNRGLRKATGKWVLFLDADDIVMENIFDVLYRGDGIKQDIISCAGRQSDGFFTGEEILPCSLDWMVHGKIYRKAFLDRNRIWFHPKVRIYEDSFFNMVAFYYARKQNGILDVEDICFCLMCNENSTTRKVANFFERTNYERIEMITELVGQYYEVFPEECLARLKHDREYLPEKEGDGKTWYLFFDCVKRLTGIEDYGGYCNFLGAEPRPREEALYGKWRRAFDTIKLSVLVPLRESHTYTAATIHALYDAVGSRAGQVEVILTDDASTRPDYEYARRDGMRILYNAGILRMGGNRNRALRMAKGEWVTFLDHDDEITAELVDEAFRGHGSGLCVVTGESINVDMAKDNPQAPYHCIEVVHGTLYRRGFLKENGIWFLDGLDTSEDVYFNRRANIMARVLYGEGGACEKSPVYYRWIWREGSAFNRTYNGRCYEEEFYREYARAFLAAYDLDLDRGVKAGHHLKLVYWACHQLKSFEENSRNFKKANAKYFMGILLVMEDTWGFDRDSFYAFLDRHDHDFKRENPGEYVLREVFYQNRQYAMKYLKMAEGLPEEWKGRLKAMLL